MDDWDRFLEYARFARAKPSFDAEDRDKPLAVADVLRAMLAEAGRGGDWFRLSKEIVRRERFSDLAVIGRTRWFDDWARADGDSLAGALAAVNAGAGADPLERFEEFAGAAERAASAQPGGADPGDDEYRRLALITGSMLNFALNPLELPVVRPGYYGPLEKLLGHAGDGNRSLAEQYRHHLEFAATVRERLVQADVEIRDMLDVQALILSAGRHRSFWLDPASPRSEPISPRRGAPDSYLALCAIYRDEAPYLREWIEFHRLAGVERFFLYDNRSNDDHLRVLAPYVESGIAVVHDWHPYLGQIAAYEHCIRHHGDAARWIAFIDADEFLFSPQGESLQETLRKFEEFPGVAVNWALFGTSGHVEPPPGLVIESYLERAEDPDSHWYKSIVDPGRVVACDVHGFHYDTSSAVDENGYPVGLGWTKSISRSRLRLNHYVTKSEAEHARRRARLSATGIPHYVDLQRWERAPTARDEAILIYLDRLRTALARG